MEIGNIRVAIKIPFSDIRPGAANAPCVCASGSPNKVSSCGSDTAAQCDVAKKYS